MKFSDSPAVSISVDMKKYRMRLHKSTLHLLGDPNYVQLLVSPDHSMVAIRSVKYPYSGDQTHKINKRQLTSDNSIEIYSRLFTQLLLSTAGVMNTKTLYRLTGRVCKERGVALFPLKTIEAIEE